MLDPLNWALLRIVDLLRLRKEVKRTDLEIGKLQREQKREESLIQRPTFEEIVRYDPKTRERMRLARKIERSMRGFVRPILLVLLVIFGFAAYILFLPLILLTHGSVSLIRALRDWRNIPLFKWSMAGTIVLACILAVITYHIIA